MQRILNLRNRMREICSSGSVGERGGNDPLYPEYLKFDHLSWISYVDPSSSLRPLHRFWLDNPKITHPKRGSCEL